MKQLHEQGTKIVERQLAESIADRMQEQEEDDWTYRAGQSGDFWVIRCYDEDGIFLGEM